MTLLNTIVSILLFIGVTHQSEINERNIVSEGVYFVMDPECPLSKRFSKYVNEIDSKGLSISVIFMDKNEARVDDFIKIYLSKQVNIINDLKGRISKTIGATVFPQSFVVNKEGKVIYGGLINNWYSSLSRKRKGPSRHYLQDAIDEYRAGAAVSIPFVEPIGCYIEY